jgi:hypothetical protein
MHIASSSMASLGLSPREEGARGCCGEAGSEND